MDLPGIRREQRVVVITVAAREAGLSYGQSQSARRSYKRCSGVVLHAGEFILREDRALELSQGASQELIHGIELAVAAHAQNLNRLLIRTEDTVVLGVEVAAAEVELVLAARPGHVRLRLGHVLRAAEWNAVAGCQLRISRKVHWQSQHGGAGAACHVQRRAYGDRAERLQLVDTV